MATMGCPRFAISIATRHPVEYGSTMRMRDRDGGRRGGMVVVVVVVDMMMMMRIWVLYII
jgi:hypothetical protein